MTPFILVLEFYSFPVEAPARLKLPFQYSPALNFYKPFNNSITYQTI